MFGQRVLWRWELNIKVLLFSSAGGAALISDTAGLASIQESSRSKRKESYPNILLLFPEVVTLLELIQHNWLKHHDYTRFSKLCEIPKRVHQNRWGKRRIRSKRSKRRCLWTSTKPFKKLYWISEFWAVQNCEKNHLDFENVSKNNI